MAGELTLWVNGKDKGKYSHEVSEEIDTHLEDGSINPKYDSEFFLDIDCDDECVCTIARREDEIYKIEAKVTFHKKKDAPYSGHHSD